jgi:hypothetical protein
MPDRFPVAVGIVDRSTAALLEEIDRCGDELGSPGSASTRASGVSLDSRWIVPGRAARRTRMVPIVHAMTRREEALVELTALARAVPDTPILARPVLLVRGDAAVLLRRGARA